MEFIYSEPQGDAERIFGGRYYIHALGKIEPGDDTRFQSFLDSNHPPPGADIYIDSAGGDVDAAIGIGRLIRDARLSTSIGQLKLGRPADSGLWVARDFSPGSCLSAATLIFIGGRLRHFPEGAKFGVHQFSFKDPLPNAVARSQALSAKIAAFVSDMGVSPRFLEISSSTDAREIRYLDEETLRDLKVVTGGTTDVRWVVEAHNQMLYVRGERDSIYGHHKVMLGYTKPKGFFFWAVIEAQGRADELTSFGVVEIVLNGEEYRIDISERCTRVSQGEYVNIFAPISQGEAKELALSDSFGVQVRFSREAGFFLGASAMDTTEGQAALGTLFDVLSS